MSAKPPSSDDGAGTPDRYSDNFDSDDEKKTSEQKRTPTSKKIAGHKDKCRRRGSDSSRARVQGQRLRKDRGNSQRRRQRNSQTSESVDTKQNHDSFTSRVLSASRNRINELRNKVEELKIKIKELEKENKMYKTLQFRHEKTIQNINDKESNLPMILDKHNNDIRSLREQNRRLREKYEKSDRLLRDAEDELEKVKMKLKKFRELVEDKGLLERDELSHRIAKVEMQMEEKETKMKELEKHIEILKKNHKHEMGIEVARQKDVKKQLEELKVKNSQLEHQLKEKERALGYQNIHNLRQGKSPRSNSPDVSLVSSINRKAASMTDLNPRDRAKFYSEKQRADRHKLKELKELKEGKKLQKQKEAKVKNTSQTSPPELSFSRTNGTLEVSADQGDKEEKENAGIESTAKEPDTERRQQNVDVSVKDGTSEVKMATENLQEQDVKRRRERLELEKNNTKEMQEKLWHEKNDIGKTEEERQEYKILERDLVLQAERRKKDDLLNRLKVLDKGNISTIDAHALAGTFKNFRDKSLGMEVLDELSFNTTTRSLHNKFSHEMASTPHLENQRKRQMMGNDSGDYLPSSGSTRGQIKNPNSKLPSVLNDDDELFLKISSNSSSNTKIRQNDKNSNLLESLFGPQTKSASTTSVGEENDVFSIPKTLSKRKVDDNSETLFSTKSPFSNNQTKTTNLTSPWGKPPSKTSTSVFDSDKQPSILRGGLASTNDLSGNKAKMQPHQQRQQQSKFLSVKPSMTAIENFDDDIEEVVL